MTIYQEILNWSQSRPNFIKDALRRIVSNSVITQNDIDELVLLLKKEKGDTSVAMTAIPFDNTHIPTAVSTGTPYPKLISIKDPVNICALHSQGHLQFANNGLTVVYGNNGSGKSSYSRILRKLCWSRNQNIELKKNVFVPSSNQQQVDFIIEENGINTNYRWKESEPSHAALGSIYVYDTDCGDIYVNRENPTVYKPIGIDLLERLIPLLNIVSQKLSSEIIYRNTQKPILEPSLNSTRTAQWYVNIESQTRNDIDSYIQFSNADTSRKQELLNLINAQNPQQNIQNLTNFKSRIENYFRQFAGIETHFSAGNIEEIRNLKSRYESINQAYSIATGELRGLNTIEGFGTNPWRNLWNAAKNFAHSNGMSDGQNFPSEGSLEKCVLCQQDLDERARQRLQGFSNFILNDVSTQLTTIQSEIQQKIQVFASLNVPPLENFTELISSIPDFQNKYAEFSQSINLLKNAIIDFLQNGGNLNVSPALLSSAINNLLPNIELQIGQNNQLVQNRNALVTEYNELKAKEFLFNNKATILRYFDELKYKEWISICQSQLNTTIISKKIGDLMEDQAINLQHQEFINYLSFFDSNLASKVLLQKTRTTQGNTFQKCGLRGIVDNINSVLSEGEQKIIALSNFLAECTIDGRKNSIIFDDPVNSLDMNYKESIAKKIVEISHDRQVIILTHDLYFLRLLKDTHYDAYSSDCQIVGIDKYNEISGIVSDEIPYLAKNVQERINSIRRILVEHDALQLTDVHGRETKLDSARKRFRMLLERSVEEILSNKTYERFSKNIHLRKGNLSSYIITEKSDVDFLLGLFGKYSKTEHDGVTPTIPELPNKTVIEQDITDYSSWKESFKTKLKAWKDANNYN
jgi:energy-coupling factor transporter ATP-binding protein EcfA2